MPIAPAPALRLAAGLAAMAGFAIAIRQEARAAERARPAPGRFLDAAGTRLHLLDAGTGGPAVLLLHGNGGMVEEMVASGLVGRLARHRRVLVPDRPGSGRTRRPRGADAAPEAQAAVMAAALRRLGTGPVVVFGHSFGALVALALALDHPALVRGLVLAGPYAMPEPRADVALAGLPALPGLGDAWCGTLGPPAGRLLAGPLVARVFQPLPVPRRFAREWPRPLALRPSQLRAMAEDTAAMLPAATRLAARLGDLRAPLTVMAGDGDRMVAPDRHARPLHAAVPGSRLVMVPGAGHMVHHATPETAAEEIERLAA